MKHYYFSRKRRQLKYIAKRIRILLAANGGQRNEQIDRLSAKLVKMVKRTRQLISGKELAKSLGAAALLFGLAVTNPANGQNFAPSVDNPFGITPVGIISAPTFGDLDGDGDLDMLTNSYDSIATGREFHFYENIGTPGGPAFAAPVKNPFSLDSQGSYFDASALGDLDDDGDLDIISIQQYGRTRYFENTGTPTAPVFAAPNNVAPFGLDTLVGYLSKPNIVDLDNDGDLDILVGEYAFEDMDGNEFYGDFKYFENTGTASAPAFAAGVRNPFGLTNTYYFNFATVADLDGDGDYDVLSAEGYGKFQYFENTGTASAPQFAAPVEEPFNIELIPNQVDEDAIYMPTFVDLDSDTDVDLMVSEYIGGFRYLENMTTNPTGLKELAPAFEMEVFPNPVQNRLLIRTEEELKQIEIIDLLGRTVDRHIAIDNSISMDHLASGVYTLRATDMDGNVVLMKIEKL